MKRMAQPPTHTECRGIQRDAGIYLDPTLTPTLGEMRPRPSQAQAVRAHVYYNPLC